MPVALVGVALTLLLFTGGGRRADLVEKDVNVSPGSFEPGQFVWVAHAVKNRGDSAAAPSISGFYLVKKGTRIRLLGMRVRTLYRGDGDIRRTEKRIPFDAPVGNYHVVACADDHHEVRESNERNNCSASTNWMKVVANH
jgi:hypothetical protein